MHGHVFIHDLLIHISSSLDDVSTQVPRYRAVGHTYFVSCLNWLTNQEGSAYHLAAPRDEKLVSASAVAGTNR